MMKLPLKKHDVAQMQEEFTSKSEQLGWKKNSGLYYKTYGDKDWISSISFDINKKTGDLKAYVRYSNMKLNDLAEHIRVFPEREKTTKIPISRQILGVDSIPIDGLTKIIKTNNHNIQNFANELNAFSDANYASCHTIEQAEKLLDFNQIDTYPRQAAAKIALSIYFKKYDDALDIINNFKNVTHEEWSDHKRAATIFLKRIGALPE